MRRLAALCLAALGAALSWAGAEEKESVVSQDIVIRGKGRTGPPLPPQPAKPEKPIYEEVLRSLDLYRRDYTTTAPKARVIGVSRRLSLPFPEPPYLVFSPKAFPARYERWIFEVFADGVPVWKAEGVGEVEGRLSWDGNDAAGQIVARIGQAYYFRFTGLRDGRESSVSSDPIELRSMQYRENLGGIRLEVSNSLIFAAERAAFLDSAAPYLLELAGRLRRFNPKDKPYLLILYHREPGSKAARLRAAALKRYFSRELVVNPANVLVELHSIGGRGDVAACSLPPEEGARVGGE